MGKVKVQVQWRNSVYRLEQPEKAFAPMFVTVVGTVKVVSDEQETNALEPMVISAVCRISHRYNLSIHNIL